jgi:hypothetical protein
VKTIEREVFKLGAIRQIGLPDGLFADVAPKNLACGGPGWPQTRHHICALIRTTSR